MRRPRPPRGGPEEGTGLPRWVLLPAALGALLVLLPLVALAARVEWARFPVLVTSPSATDALLLSLRTAAASTAVCVLLGVPMALVLSRARGRVLRLVRALVLLPLVLPPVVGGVALLAAFGRQGLLGQHLDVLGVRLAYSTAAVVLAQSFVALPFLVVGVEGALRTAGRRYADVAAVLGAAPGVVLRRVVLPQVAPGLAAGSVLAFARALGEFGATLTFAGSRQGVTRTLPSEVYLLLETDRDAAVALAFVLVAVALVVVAAVRGRAAGEDR